MTGEFSRPRLRSGVDLTVVLGFVLDRRDVADRGVKPGLIEPVDPVQGGEFGVVDTSPRAFWFDAFGLVEPDQALSLSAVVKVPTVPIEASAPASASRSLYPIAQY